MITSRALIILSALVTVFGFDAARPAPAADLVRDDHTVSWGSCPFALDARIRCGELDVPENWQAPEGRHITLRIAHIPARDEDSAAPDPIAFLTGGPGFSAFASLDVLKQMEMNRERDVITLEPRGYFYSEPALTCPSVGELAACQADYTAQGIDVTQYTTENSVRDLEALRRALGHETWNLFGVSYGTFWASHYQRMYPEALRAVIMDSPYPPHAGYDWNREGALNAFERLFNDCRSRPDCDAAYPDLRTRFIAALRRMHEGPVNAGGDVIPFPEAFDLLYSAIYLDGALPRTPMMIDAAARGDFATYVDLGERPWLPMPEGYDRSASVLGLNASVMCADDIFFDAGPETRTALSAPWPQDIYDMITPEGWDYDRRCALWQVPKSDPVLNAPVTTDLPTLVLVGAYDPITPPEFAQAMLLTKSNGTLALDPQGAHALFTNFDPCLQGLMARFFDAPAAHLDVSCLMTRDPVAWMLPDRP